MTEAEFESRSVEEIQATFRHQHILVTDMRSDALQFDSRGLSTLSTLSTVTDIQGVKFFLLRSNRFFLTEVIRSINQPIFEDRSSPAGYGAKFT
jgi:hypothetical protein